MASFLEAAEKFVTEVNADGELQGFGVQFALFRSGDNFIMAFFTKDPKGLEKIGSFLFVIQSQNTRTFLDTVLSTVFNVCSLLSCL